MNVPEISKAHSTLVSWNKKEGDRLKRGELLCRMQSGPTTVGFAAPKDGYLAKIIMEDGIEYLEAGRVSFWLHLSALLVKASVCYADIRMHGSQIPDKDPSVWNFCDFLPIFF